MHATCQYLRSSLAFKWDAQIKYAFVLFYPPLELRRAVRSSMIKPVSGTHTHDFPAGKEVHNTEDDTWTKTCTECGYSVTFEKM